MRHFARALGPRLVVCLVVAIAGIPGLNGQTTRTRLSDVLARTADYVRTYAEQLSAVVGQEEYVQTVTERTGGAEEAAEATSLARKRVLLSEFALIQASGNTSGWEGFRDVFEVDGMPVHDRTDRLERLFAESPATAIRQARTIADESARYNIGPVSRNFNVPTAVLFFLHPSNKWRFRFKSLGEAQVGGRSCWVIRFEEHETPTIIRTPAHTNVPANGRAWVEPESGRVLRTELHVEGFLPSAKRSSATLSVDYGFDQRLEMWVPIEMREEYSFQRGKQAPVVSTMGVAKYSNFRRFVTDARLVIPK